MGRSLGLSLRAPLRPCCGRCSCEVPYCAALLSGCCKVHSEHGWSKILVARAGLHTLEWLT